jgi:hypothetical protein
LYNKSKEYSNWVSPSSAGSEGIWVYILFFWSFVVQEVDEGHKGSEHTTKFDVHISGSLFEYVPRDMPVSLIRLSSGKQQNIQSGEYSPQVPDYRDSEFSYVGLREFC